MLAAEGQTHKRQRRVAIPAFSSQTMHDLVPLVFRKTIQLRDKWSHIFRDTGVEAVQGHRLDVCNWTSRFTFDVMGSVGMWAHTISADFTSNDCQCSGFDYEFNAIEHEGNELLRAYADMFEVAVSRHLDTWTTTWGAYFPILTTLFVSHPGT